MSGIRVKGQPHDDPIWARGFTRLLDIIIENTRRLGLTSAQIRMLLVLNLLAFRGMGTSYRRIASLTGTSREGARKMIRRMADRGWLELDSEDRVHKISTQPYLDKALELATTTGPRRQREPIHDPNVEFHWTIDNLHFTRLPALLLEYTELQLTATEIHLILVVFYLAHLSGYIRSEIIHTSLAEVAELMGVHRSTITRTITSLENKGLVVRATQPGKPLAVDFTPLFNTLRGGARAIASNPAPPLYNKETLARILAASPFRNISPEIITSLTRQYGADRVALTVDILTQQYKHRRIHNPARLLRAMLAKGITPDEEYIPWHAREEMRRKHQQQEYRRMQLDKIQRELDERTQKEWDKLPEEEREKWRNQVREIFQEWPIPIPIENTAKYLFQEGVVFDLVANERGTPPERRERIRSLLYKGGE